MIKRLLIFVLCSSLFTSVIFAGDARFGFNLSYPLILLDPTAGYRAALYFQPDCFLWNRTRLYFDASYAHWSMHKKFYPYRSINIFTIAPIIRLYFKKYPCVLPYGELSVGAAYLSHCRFGNRNLGIHFAFQDVATLGILLGKEHGLALSLSAMHYSNASMAKMNAGITVPLLVSVGYNFG